MELLETLWQDLSFSLRTLAKSPGFAITAVLILSIGIGVNVTFFHSLNLAFNPSLLSAHARPSRVRLRKTSSSLIPTVSRVTPRESRTSPFS